MNEQQRLTIREQLARRMFPDAVIEDSPTGSGVDIRVYDKPNETRTWYNFDPFRSAEDKDALVAWLAADDARWERFDEALLNLILDTNQEQVSLISKQNEWLSTAQQWTRIKMTAPLEVITLAAARALGIQEASE